MFKHALALASTLTICLLAWHRQHEQKRLLNRHYDTGRYTVVINTYKRHELLLVQLAHYSQCPGVSEVRVLWSEDQQGPPAPLRRRVPQQGPQIIFHIQPNRSLNLRYRPLPNLTTDAVVQLDDDISVPCWGLDKTYQVWRAHQQQLVGWFPQLHTGPPGGPWTYQPRFSTLFLHGAYSIVLTKGAMLHKDYLALYSRAQPPGVLSLVDTLHNCEDVALQFLLSNLTGLPPVFVHLHRLTDYGQGPQAVKGISSATLQHHATRSHCLNEFARLYGRMPLVTQSLHTSPGVGSTWRALKLRLSPATDSYEPRATRRTLDL